MKRRILCFVLTMAMVLSMLVVVPAVTVSADTTVLNISTGSALRELATAVNAGTYDSGVTVNLTANIDISDAEWTSIGTSTYPFRGTFNGNGHTISGLYQNKGGAVGGNVGLFGNVSAVAGGTTNITNFKLTGKTGVTWQIECGNGGSDGGTVAATVRGVAGSNITVNFTGIWSSVSFDASNSLMTGAGGILGSIAWVSATDTKTTVNIDSCWYSGNMASPGAGVKDYGGIFGWTRELPSSRGINITNCLVTGTLKFSSGSTYDDNGGIAGFIKGTGYSNNARVTGCIKDTIFAGTLWSPNKSGTTVAGYIISEISTNDGVDPKFQIANCYYVPSYTGGQPAGWFGYPGNTARLTSSNVTSKTLDEVKAMTASNVTMTDTSKWHFYNNGTDVPIPAMIYDNIIAPTPASVFDDMTQSEFTISSGEDMAEFAALVNAGTTFAGKTIKLGADVALNTTIGATNSSKYFSGNFDGQGHTVTITQSLSSPDGLGGLFSMVRVPANSTVTIKDVHITGTISVSGGAGFMGGLISTVDAGTSGNGGTLNVTNVWNTVRINLSSNSSHPSYNGGFIGFIRHADGLKPLTVTFESCYWDGTINAGGPLYHDGGFIGYTGNNKAGRTLTINISNSVANGTFQSNVDGWNQQFGMLVGYLKGGYTTNDATAKPTLNVSNVVSMGKATYAKNTGSDSLIGVFDKIESIGELNVNNLYYTEFNRTGVSGNFPVVASGSITSGSATLKTKAQMVELPASAFASSSKWNVSAGYPCPAGIVSTFGSVPSTLQATVYDVTDVFEIGTAAALKAIADEVNAGTHTYAGKTILLTADIDMTGTGFNGIGNGGNYPFMGSLNGQGHTVNITQSKTNTDGNAGFICMLRVPANGTVTIQNVHVTGTIDSTVTSDNWNGYISGLVGLVDAGTSGDGGTANLINCWSTVRINSSTSRHWAMGGLVGFTRHAAGLKPLTLNIDSCLWDGILNQGAATSYYGGLIGYTGNNNAGRTLTINITNTVAAGQIWTNQGWDDGGYLIGYAKGSNSSDATAKVTINLSDVVSIGKVTYTAANSHEMCGMIGKIDGTTELNLTNLYYMGFSIKGESGSTPCPFIGVGEATTSTNVAKMTASQIYNLTTSSFTDAEDWNKTGGYNPCPAGIVSTFGSVPASLEYTASVNTIGSVGELIEFRDAVNSGTSYAGDVFKLTADIDLIGIEWQEIGLYSTAPFSGVFDGDGHTISNMTSAVSADATGALFGYVSNATIKNLTLTGRITTSGARNFIASVVNCVSGDTTLQNVESSVYITQAAIANAMNYTGGLVGFIHNTNNTNLTINGCTFSGTINTGGQTRAVAGILGYTGWGNSGVTKTVTITNTQFTGTINLNDTSYYYQNAGFIGYVKCAGGTITINISNSYSDGKIYFNRASAWTRSNNGECGQILGGVDSGVTLNIANTVSYRPAYLYTSVSSGTPVASSKVVLGEIGSFGGSYSVDTAAVVEGMEIYAEKCTVTISGSSKNAIRFVATIASASCSGAETQDATFGVYIMTKAMYDLFRGALTTANLDATSTSTTMITKVNALKCKNTSDGYVVSAIVYGFSTTAEKTGELVAIPYAGTRLGEAITVTYNSL